ncbi:diacylglycerol kinase [Lutibacter sp. B2]|nr:diacylglycerol kinase [Lutibacter sp. B2]
MKVKNIIDSFNYAIKGILYAIRTQRNMKIHYMIGMIVVLGSLFSKISKMELIVLCITIGLVIITEMINTAIEAAIDLTVDAYHPLAKIAKDVSAGAVLISAVNAVIVGYVIFFDEVSIVTEKVLNKIRNTMLHTTFISFFIVVMVVVSIKVYIGKGTPLRGGMPSGHTAVAFSILTSISFMSSNTIVIILCFLMALLVAQSRVDANVHTIFQVMMGALLGTFITVLFFQMIY